MATFSTVLVSNRLPVSVSKVNGKLTYTASSGGLATAMASLEADNKVWVGWPGIASDELNDKDKKDITRELEKRGCLPVFLTSEQIKLFYEGYANDTLWPLFHYFQSLAIYKDSYWRAYCDVNKEFMKVTKKASAKDATIWVQDYQLMLLPKLIRKTLPSSSIGFFLHIPFPSYEIFRLLPERREILEGLLGADLLGFHIYDYARHFLSSCLRLLGIPNHHGTMHYQGRVIRADSFPISIDYDKFVEMRTNDDVIAARQSVAEAHDTEFTLLSIDRLDYSKGIPERLDAYRMLLENNPEYLGRVKLIMVAVPSRTEVETYKDLRDQIEVTVSRINGEYGTSEWAPISYQFQNLPFHEIVALYAEADAMLVTPIRDGMNLVAKEYVASKSSNDPGVLILSEMAGAVDELPESLTVNPNDTKSIEKAIKQAFRMSKREKLARQEQMQTRISDYPVARWADDFFRSLANLRIQQRELARIDLKADTAREIVNAYKSARQRLIMLDYDGTLQSFKSTPGNSAAKPGKLLYSLIESLAKSKNTTVCIVSGRKKTTLDSWFGKLPVELIAEHGAWQKDQGVWRQHDIDFEPARSAVTSILKDYTSRTPGARLEQKDFAVVWHYRNVPVELAYVRASNLRHELQAALDEYDVSVHGGHKIVEVKHDSVDKGAAAQQFIREYSPDFILLAGDDYTDEDMFRVAPHDSYTIKVGPGETRARLRVSSVKSMIKLLSDLDQ